jgi:hypothetical protein
MRNTWLTRGNGGSGGAGEDLDGTGGDPAVTCVDAAVCDGDVLPREGIEQGPPVLLDREHELAAALVDVLRGGLDRMQRVGGHDLAIQVDLAEYRHRHRHLVGLRADQGRERVHLISLGVLGTVECLAIQPHPHQRRRVSATIGVRRCGEPGQTHQPPADRGIEGLGISVGEHSPHRGLRRWPGRQGTGTDVRIRQDPSRNIADPAGDGGVAPHSGDHRCGGESQRHRDRVITTLDPAGHHSPHPAAPAGHRTLGRAVPRPPAQLARARRGQ